MSSSFLSEPSSPPLTFHGIKGATDSHAMTFYELKQRAGRSQARDGADCSPLYTQVYHSADCVSGIVFSQREMPLMDTLPPKDTGVPIALVVTFDSRQLTIVARQHEEFTVVYSTL